MDNTIIKVENISKIYKLYDRPIDRLKESVSILRKKYHKDFYALNNISFEIKKGQTVGIVGKNGSGKSTLLKIITGLLTPTSGKIEVSGRISALLELGAGFNPEYTGIENIYLNGAIMGFSKEEMDKKIEDILSFADIGDFVYQSVKTYSSGMFARLAFAVAINVEPDILIVDEALSVGDMAFQNKCFNKIQKFIREGKTVLFVSHNLSAIRLLCDSTIWINNGDLVMYDDTDVVTDIYEKESNIATNDIRISAQVSEAVYRIGNYKCKGNLVENSECWINNAWISNNKDQVTNVFETGKMIKIKFEIINKAGTPESVSVGVAFVRADNLEICRINNIRDDLPIVLTQEVNLVELNIPKLSLLSGEYFLSFYLAKSNIIEAYHVIENVEKIELKTPISKCGWRMYDGIVAIQHTWTIN